MGWADEHNKLNDAQNGFRKKRSTLDHLSALSSIIGTRGRKKKSTFAVFIDLTKAYDSIQRQLLWSKFSESGIGGKMMRALNSLYENVKSCVKINNMQTSFFEVNVGLKQGCLLSPLLFIFYIDDLNKLNFVISSVLINGKSQYSYVCR